MMGYIYLIFFCLLFFGLPIILTILNIINLFKEKPIHPDTITVLTMVLGILFSLVLFGLWEATKDYQEPLKLTGMEMMDGIAKHTPVASWHLPTIATFSFFGLAGMFIIIRWQGKLSPVINVLCISCLYIGCGLSVIFIIQLSENLGVGVYLPFEVALMSLLPFNYILCSIRLIKNTIKYQVSQINSNNQTYDSPVLNKCKSILSHSISWIIIAFVFALPFLGLLIIILILFGQKPDAVIKAFTETSDWTFSQQISPPPILKEYQGHYLCTAALKGSKRLVKPMRFGVRHGVKIVVNRQLCVANAFEQCIQEKLPKLHRIIRKFYDTYGYPLSKHITTSKRADIVYLAMKPLEWLFVLFLYTVDKKPENRISMQYIPQQEK